MNHLLPITSHVEAFLEIKMQTSFAALMRLLTREMFFMKRSQGL